MKPEQERLINVLKDTIGLLCKNSLTYTDQVQVQGLICITVDKQDVLVMLVHESIGQARFEPCVACGHAKEAPPGLSTSNKRKRRQRSSSS
jgi:Zn ribbon nucleic-acid-binding protein